MALELSAVRKESMKVHMLAHMLGPQLVLLKANLLVIQWVNRRVAVKEYHSHWASQSVKEIYLAEEA